MKIRYVVKMVESCIDCEYSESNFEIEYFRCHKFNLDLTENSDKFHPDCRLPNNLLVHTA